MKEHADPIALFRFEIIAPLLSIRERGELKSCIEDIAKKPHLHPVKGPTWQSPRTIEDWLYRYRKEGLEGLCSQKRRDRGRSRVIDDETAALIEDIIEGSNLDGPNLLKELGARVDPGTRVPSLSSLYRFVHARGLELGQKLKRLDHRRYAFDLAGECWQGDVMYGPHLPGKDGKRKRTYLIALLDDATRLVPHAEFYFEQHLRALKDCLKQAFLKRGLPQRLYFDNGKIFRSRMILGLVARLGIHLTHSRPYRPQGRAKNERFFGTVRRQFLSRFDERSGRSLEELNRLFFAWLEGDYHVRGHRGLEGQSPLDRWIELCEGIRPLPQDVDLKELFYESTTRRVAKDGTFTLKGSVFEAKPEWIGLRIEVRYDPYDLRRVVIASEHQAAQYAYPVDVRANRKVQRQKPKKRPPDIPLRSLEAEAQDFYDQKKEPKPSSPDNDNPDSQEDDDAQKR